MGRGGGEPNIVSGKEKNQQKRDKGDAVSEDKKASV